MKIALGIVTLLTALGIMSFAMSIPASADDPPAPEYTALEQRVEALEAIVNTNLLQLACHVAEVSAQNEGLHTTHCRQHDPPEIKDGFALVTITVKVPGIAGRFLIAVYLHQTAWQVERMSILHG